MLSWVISERSLPSPQIFPGGIFVLPLVWTLHASEFSWRGLCPPSVCGHCMLSIPHPPRVTLTAAAGQAPMGSRAMGCTDLEAPLQQAGVRGRPQEAEAPTGQDKGQHSEVFTVIIPELGSPFSGS